MLTIKKIVNNRIWISAILALVISLVIIPLTIILINPTPLSMPKGIRIKSGSRLFYNFLEEIKQRDDILVLGTSETGNSLNGNNYYSLLNRDKEFNQSVHVLGGAGRSANIYFPLILDNPKAFKDLNIIYYINPTYWREGLNQFSIAYLNRYIESSLVYHVKDIAKKEEVYDDFMDNGLKDKNNFSFLVNRTIEI
jgi:hypothetical protein